MRMPETRDVTAFPMYDVPQPTQLVGDDQEVVLSKLPADMEPRLVWSHFEDISAIPRPSKHEEKMIEHLMAWARDRGHEVHQDEAGSVCIRVAATPGHEGAKPVVLQGHMDMVCEKNSDVEHDFMTQGINLVVDGDWVRAQGTTLGADNGIGVAAGMAVADDPEAVHGPLELLCTVDEETGLTGAKQLDPSIVQGRTMLNLDTEEDSAVYIGCSGGADSNGLLALSRRRGLLGSVPVKLVIRGLRGGHSGLNIVENRGNALKLAVGVVLNALEQNSDIDLVDFEGGSKHNAIPREAFVTLRIQKTQIEGLRSVTAACHKGFMEEFGTNEPDLEVVIEELDDSEALHRVLENSDRDTLLRLIDSLPHGVLAMSTEVEGLVETSSNLAVVKTEDEAVRIVTSHRSSVMPALFAVRRRVGSIFRQAGATVKIRDVYPGWKPNLNSPIVQTTVSVFEKVFGRKPEIKAIHAGLECGLLIEKVPDMDCVSIGPQIENAHSPEERLQISSTQRFYTHLKAVLAELA